MRRLLGLPGSSKVGCKASVRFRLILLGVLLSSMTFNCNEPPEDPTPPAAPRWVLKSLPEAWVEQGIDAASRGGGAIVLMWHPNGEPDLSGYELFRADSVKNSSYQKRYTVDLFEPGTDTLYYDDNVEQYRHYYYYLRAFDLAGNRSPSSDTIDYTLLNAPVPYTPVNDTVAIEELYFEWMDRPSHFVYSNEFVLRLERVIQSLQTEAFWISRFNNDCYECGNTTPQGIAYFPVGDPWPGNVLNCLQKNDSLKAGQYRWKVKAIGEVNNQTNRDESSSESEWVYFFLE